MSEELEFDGLTEASGTDPESRDVIEVRRNGPLLAAVGVLAAVVAVAYLRRAVSGGSVLDWVMAAGVSLIAALHLAGFVDTRTPLLMADELGVRIRLGRLWRGLPWSAVERIEHTPRRGLLRDGRLAVVPSDTRAATADLDARARLHVWFSTRMYAAPLAVPLGLATRLAGASDERLTDRLGEWAGSGESQNPEPRESEPRDPEPRDPEPRDRARWHDPRPAIAAGIGAVAGRLRLPQPGNSTADREHTVPPMPAPLVASATPAPLRATNHARRVDLVVGALAVDPAAYPEQTVLPEEEQLRRAAQWEAEWDVGHDPDQTEVIDDQSATSAGTTADPKRIPVLGPQLSAARGRLSLSVDEVADRTRIRPHVIEAIEVDDFVPCGGDFYARGHLRTLARVLGIEVGPLLTTYDELYTHEPVSPQRVFEAELATGSTSAWRGTRGGPNWSVLVAAAMAVILAWSIARLVIDGPVAIDQVPGLGAGSGGLHQGAGATGAEVPVVVRAAGGGAHVVIRDGNGKIVFTGDLAYGSSRTLKAVPPIRVETSDGSVEMVVNGDERGHLGDTGRPASATFN